MGGTTDMHGEHKSAYKIWVIQKDGKRVLESCRLADGIKY